MSDAKRRWYVAVCDVSGMFENNPASFEAATIYGPYTREQADAFEAIGAGFPPETMAVLSFQVDDRPRVGDLIASLERQVEDAIQQKAADTAGYAESANQKYD
jgi:hypothetical protein